MAWHAQTQAQQFVGTTVCWCVQWRLPILFTHFCSKNWLKLLKTLLPVCPVCQSFSDKGNIHFSTVMWSHVSHMIKGSYRFKNGSSLSLQVTMTISLREFVWIYGWELLEVYHWPVESCNHKHCDSGYIMFSIFHVAYREYNSCMNSWLEAPYGDSLHCLRLKSKKDN